MRIISISGLDGSGKSTQIEMLKTYLESQGKKVFYFHAIQFGLANVISQKIKSLNKSAVPRTELASGAGVTKANWLQIQLRKMFLQIDLIRFKSLVRKLENENYDYILTDRYFYDSIINIEYLRKRELSSQAWELSSLLKPDIAIYLQTDPEMIMQRERKPDQGLEYLQKKKGLYDKYAGIWNLKIINGNRNKEEIFEEITKIISNSPNF